MGLNHHPLRDLLHWRSLYEIFISIIPNWLHFKNIYKRDSKDVCLFSFLSGFISDHDSLITCSSRRNKNKRAYGVSYPQLRVCVWVNTTADMCLCVESYCGFEKNGFLLQKHNFRLLSRLLGIWVIGHSNQEISACAPGWDCRGPTDLSASQCP